MQKYGQVSLKEWFLFSFESKVDGMKWKSSSLRMNELLALRKLGIEFLIIINRHRLYCHGN